MPIRDNFADYLQPNTGTGCLEWTRYVDPGGYGRLRYDGKAGYIHVFVWESAYGPVPEGLLVRHKCDNPRCARLDHMELGNDLDNARDRDSRGRSGTLIHGKYKGQSAKYKPRKNQPTT